MKQADGPRPSPRIQRQRTNDWSPDETAPKSKNLSRGGRQGSAATVRAERDDAQLTPELRLKTILVPIDFSAASRQALDVAVTLARQFSASLPLLHVAEIGSPACEIGATDFPDMAMITRRKARAELKALCGGQRLPTLPLKIHVRCGWPFEGGKRAWFEITQAAKELAADLVVIGTEGRTGLEHVWLGSTAERVVQHAPCAVLTVREREARASGLRSATFNPTAILVPTDFSNAAAAALPYAAALVKKFGVEVTLVLSLEPWLYASYALAAPQRAFDPSETRSQRGPAGAAGACHHRFFRAGQPRDTARLHPVARRWHGSPRVCDASP
jgi:nucleotide-binding universal stress UspA family protein